MANRKDRRKAMKQQGLTSMPRVRTYNVSEDQVRDITQREMEEHLANIKKDVIKWISDCMLASFVIAMKTQYGFGVKRMTRMLDEVTRQFDAITDGSITEVDLLKCAEDYGIKITDNGGANHETGKQSST
jgi:hypothetical protein